MKNYKIKKLTYNKFKIIKIKNISNEFFVAFYFFIKSTDGGGYTDVYSLNESHYNLNYFEYIDDIISNVKACCVESFNKFMTMDELETLCNLIVHEIKTREIWDSEFIGNIFLNKIS